MNVRLGDFYSLGTQKLLGSTNQAAGRQAFPFLEIDVLGQFSQVRSPGIAQHLLWKGHGLASELKNKLKRSLVSSWTTVL